MPSQFLGYGGGTSLDVGGIVGAAGLALHEGVEDQKTCDKENLLHGFMLFDNIKRTACAINGTILNVDYKPVNICC